MEIKFNRIYKYKLKLLNDNIFVILRWQTELKIFADVYNEKWDTHYNVFLYSDITKNRLEEVKDEILKTKLRLKGLVE